jgi:succinate dehydrogenase / fumarate reductase flavoprotein subunit
MTASERPRRDLAADVLIIGGGIAGLTAAITAKETAPDVDVLVLDKAAASTGWAGMGSRTAGLLSFVTREDDPEEFIKYCLDKIGFYLNDQDQLREYAYTSRMVPERLSQWGVDISRDDDGRVAYAKWPFPFGTAAIDPDLCHHLAARAKALGVRFADGVALVELLKRDGLVSGAAGFGLDDGAFVVAEAGAVVLAMGSQNYDLVEMWCGTGNGIRAAWLAGAEMRNAEFGNMCDFARVGEDGQLYYGVHGGAHTAHDHLTNAAGENVSQKYRPGLHTSMDPVAALAWYRETMAGNGPISVDLSDFSGKDFFRFHPKALEQHGEAMKKAGYPESQKFEVVPGFIGELSCVKVDLQMETTVPGLFAIGNTSGSGSARGGAVPTPPSKMHGMGITNAVFMGMRGGPAAAVHARAMRRGAAGPLRDAAQLHELEARLFAPLERADGVSPREVIPRIQEAVGPVDYSVIKTEARMKQALDKVLETRKLLSDLKAADLHELSRCVDAQSMVLEAEIFYRASLERTESRGFHLREDYPLQDDEHWLKWVIVKKDGDGMAVRADAVPMETYPYKPARTPADREPGMNGDLA